MEDRLELHFPLLDQIKNKEWKKEAIEIWENFFSKSKWDDVEQAMLNINPQKGTLANYVRAVMKISLDCASTFQEIYGINVDTDILLLSAFLHDACKLIEYEPDESESGYSKSYQGNIFQHGFLSAHYALLKGLPPMVISNIICHTPQTNHEICSVEGHILEHADRMVTSSLELAASLN